MQSFTCFLGIHYCATMNKNRAEKRGKESDCHEVAFPSRGNTALKGNAQQASGDLKGTSTLYIVGKKFPIRWYESPRLGTNDCVNFSALERKCPMPTCNVENIVGLTSTRSALNTHDAFHEILIMTKHLFHYFRDGFYLNSSSFLLQKSRSINGALQQYAGDKWYRLHITTRRGQYFRLQSAPNIARWGGSLSILLVPMPGGSFLGRGEYERSYQLQRKSEI